jgi:monoterpene epsilon-lactone hydrolase
MARRSWIGLAGLAALVIGAALAQDSAGPPGFSDLAIGQAAANRHAGPRHVPALTLPVPTAEVSPVLQEEIAAPYAPFDLDPKTPAAWKRLVGELSLITALRLPYMREKLGVGVEEKTITGVRTYLATPRTVRPETAARLLVHIHGGGYVFFPGEVATVEAVLMAGLGGYRVQSIDYRMPPDHPFPAALDDVVAVWKQAVTLARPQDIAVFGTSAGGGLAMALLLRAKDENLPLPGALGLGTPWADLGKVGDSFVHNEWADNVLVSYDAMVGKATRLYAGDHDLTEPYISPIYGDLSGFPPTILVSDTRDLFLSNTVRTHRKLRRAGVIADLNVYEGMSHGQFHRLDMQETHEVFTEMAAFFDRHLGR